MLHPRLKGAKWVGGAVAECLADACLVLTSLGKLLQGDEGEEDDAGVVVFILQGKGVGVFNGNENGQKSSTKISMDIPHLMIELCSSKSD